MLKRLRHAGKGRGRVSGSSYVVRRATSAHSVLVRLAERVEEEGKRSEDEPGREPLPRCTAFSLRQSAGVIHSSGVDPELAW